MGGELLDIGGKLVNQASILLVEDDANDAELVVRALHQLSIASDIIVLGDGQAALDYLFGAGEYADRDTDTQPQLILLNLNLPGMGGIEVLKYLRENDITRRIPIVILSQTTEKQDLLDCHNLGVNSYIQKRVSSDDFIETIHQLGMYWMLLNVAPPQGS